MTEYPTYETKGGQADEAATYTRLIEHLRYAEECLYVLGHLRKASGDEVIGSGFIGLGQMLHRMVSQVTKLATGSKMKWN